jgi:predicted Zn-dependent peptidase
MKLIESTNIKEKAYIEKLENGLTVIIIPKENTKKKYVIWGTHYGSIDNRFIMPKTGEEVFVPDGVAHFLEHKMFEQENGKNSLDVLMALGVDANAYTTNDHTAYLFETTNNFYEALDELMDYVQNPYFTDQNVEKEKGIIAQEIGMYDDDPGWQLYMNALDCMYKDNAVKIDIAGTVESISKIDKDVLYKCYNTFYNPSNMVLVVCGDFKPEEILQEIKNRLVKKEEQGEIKRIYPATEKGINKKYKEGQMQVSKPIFLIGFKDENLEKDKVKRHIAIEVLLNMLVGKSSALYQKMYNEGLLLAPLDIDYEFTDNYAHVMLTGQSKEPQKIQEELIKEIEKLKNNMDDEYFKRIKKKVYGDYVVEYNNVSDIARMFLSDYFKGINSFDYIEQYNTVTIEYTKEILNELFNESNMILSVIREK